MGSTSVKTIIVGDSGVGKTCLINAFRTNEFPRDYLPMVYDDFPSEINVDGNRYSFGLWDTAGGGNYDTMRHITFHEANIFIICFSVVSPTSFERVSSKWIPDIHQHSTAIPYILVGTKVDLRDDAEQAKNTRDNGIEPIDYKKGSALSLKIGALKYLECSALTQKGVTNVFDQALRLSNSFRSNSRTKSKKGGCIIQ